MMHLAPGFHLVKRSKIVIDAKERNWGRSGFPSTHTRRLLFRSVLLTEQAMVWLQQMGDCPSTNEKLIEGKIH